jgi:hypothetical protein
MAIHDGSVFSLLIDTAAVLLYFGLDEGEVCRVLSGFMGGISLLARAAVAFAFTGNRFVAVAAPLIPYDIFIEAHKYPMYYPVSVHDLGVNGLHFALLTLSLLALHVPTGAVLLGLMPGIHASLAVPVWLIAGVGVVFDGRARRACFRARPFFVAGVAAVAVAWTAHHYLGPSFPTAPPDADGRYAQAFVTAWDIHRAPLGAAHAGELLLPLRFDILFLASATAALSIRPMALERVGFWLAGQVAVSVIAITATIADEFRSGWAPWPLTALMMSRWLNLNIIVLPALIAGWAIAARGARLPAWLPRIDNETTIRAGAAAALAALLLSAVLPANRDVWTGDQPTHDAARARPGVLLAAHGIEFAQLQSGRPILLDTTLLDTLAYAPAAGPGTERILNDAYHVSLLDARTWGQFDDLQHLWESWDEDDWRRVKDRFAVTDVLVPSEWSLRLPRVARTPGLTLYSMPD